MLFIIVPIIMTVLQLILTGLAPAVLSTAGVDILLYIFTIEDMNDRVEKAHRLEIEIMAKIKNSTGSRYMYTVWFYVDGKKVCGFFQFENLQEGIHDSWNNDVYVHFFYEDGMLNEKITCTDGEVVKKINDKNSDDFDVIIRK